MPLDGPYFFNILALGKIMIPPDKFDENKKDEILLQSLLY